MILAVSPWLILGGYMAGLLLCVAAVLAWCARFRP